MLVDILNEQDGNGKLLIDFVLLLVDGSSRDLGTASDLIRKVILPDLRTEKKNRLLIVVNKIDKALSSRHWDAVHHCPDAVLQKFLEEKALSVQRRIYEDTKWEFETVCLCAGYKDPESMLQEQSYNTTYLLAKLLSMAPVKKRIPRKARTKPAFEHHASASSDDVVEKVLTAATAPYGFRSVLPARSVRQSTTTVTLQPRHAPPLESRMIAMNLRNFAHIGTGGCASSRTGKL